MAIAFDAGSSVYESSGNYVASVSVNHTCSGSNRLLVARVMVIDTDSVASVLYGGVAMTFVRKQNYASTRWTYIYALSNPALGTNSLVVNLSPSSRYVQLEGISVTGAAQTVIADSTNGGSGWGTDMTTAVTTIADGCMAFLSFNNAGDAMTPGANCTLDGANISFGYSAIKSPAGSLSMTAIVNSSQSWGTVMAAFAPYVVIVLYQIPGAVTLSGVAVSGATVRCIRQSDNVAIAEQTTDVDGLYLFEDLEETELYHLAIEYETGGVKYNALSLWDISPIEV